MRFSVFKSILDLCSSLKEAIIYMYENNTTELVSGCVDVIASINTALIENCVNNFEFDKIQRIIDELKIQTVDFEKLCDLVIDLENEIKIKVKYKLKVLFVAEVSSKWDAMASIYDAFVKRGDCEIQVVIEPYCRSVKMLDDSVNSEIILEDYLTPMGVTNIPFNEYDFRIEMPDITFFCQPYESCTMEKFWPKNMAEYTKLVYVPYYTARTIDKGKSNATYHSFFKSDAEKYSWKIVCQSEIMKKHYKNLGSQKGKNVIVTGLPKWDYSMTLSKETVECPEDWKKKITNRKVFLLNTHYQEFVKNEEHFENLKKFISVFLKNKEIAFIWRPHPLTEMVIRIEKPELWEKYKKLKKEIENSENIIYDDEPSYEPSFVYSDALFSGNSSLVVQFLLTNKPVLIAYNTYSVFEWRGWQATNDGLFDLNKFPFAVELDDKKKFINDIVNGNDEWKEQRKELLENYLALADGKCGERVAEVIINEFNKENEDVEIEINEAKTVFVIGNAEDSRLAIKNFESRNVDFAVCKEFFVDSDNYKSVSLFEVDNESYDLFVITSEETDVIKDMLLEQNIKSEKILGFWKMYNAGIPLRVCDRVMFNPQVQSFEGVILGSGHAANGILTSQLNKSFCNLAIPSQDIYYNYVTLKYCLENYPEKLKDLKYAIIDMYDYNYFNYDASQSNAMVDYVVSGGITFDEHNFSKNKDYNEISFESFVSTMDSEEFAGITDIDFANWDVNFSEIYALSDFESFGFNNEILRSRTSIVDNEQIETFDYASDIVTNIFEKTIEDNVEYLKKILELLLNINSEIKIYLTVIPKFVEVETRIQRQMYKHKLVFFEKINNLKNNYDFEFVDIKNVMYDRNNYFDATSLNWYGAIKLTNEINKMIFG